MAQRQNQGDPRAAAEKVVRVLREAGHTAYFAGGCVRDMLLGVEPTDYDVATDAPPTVVASMFNRCKLVGAAFGVVLVRLMRCEVEVATFRRETGYTDGRRPDHVEFTDAAEDARRRDFTVNGLFYDPLAGRVIDYVGGQADIAAKVIRAIGQPDERFAEDYLRMLRAVRFAARLSWPIEPATEAAIVRHAPKLARISRERIGMEVEAMLVAPPRAAAAAGLQRLTLDGPTLDEATRDAPLPMLESLNAAASYPAALAAWAIDRHADGPAGAFPEALGQMKRVQIARRWRRGLVLSNDQHATMQWLLNMLVEALGWFDHPIARRKRWLAAQRWADLAMLIEAAGARGAPLDLTAWRADVEALVADGVGVAPLVSGDDLIAAGFEPGPTFKGLLEAVYDAQLEGRVTSKPQGLAMARAIAEAAARRR